MVDNQNKGIPLVQNRKQKRAMERRLGIKGSKAQVNAIVKVLTKSKGLLDNIPKFKERLLEGDKVKLNVKRIKSHPDWERYQPAYKEFVEKNEGVVFTVEYDKEKERGGFLICLKEDTSKQKWLYSMVDLWVLDERDGKFKELHMITEDD